MNKRTISRWAARHRRSPSEASDSKLCLVAGRSREELLCLVASAAFQVMTLVACQIASKTTGGVRLFNETVSRASFSWDTESKGDLRECQSGSFVWECSITADRPGEKPKQQARVSSPEIQFSELNEKNRQRVCGRSSVPRKRKSSGSCSMTDWTGGSSLL